jgi:hypothetical protein
MINPRVAQTCSFTNWVSLSDSVCYPKKDKATVRQCLPSCCDSNLVRSNTSLKVLFKVTQCLLKSDHSLINLSKSTTGFEQDPLQAYNSSNLQLLALAFLRTKAICYFAASQLILECPSHQFYSYLCCQDFQCANWILTDLPS